ncbi:MAG: TolC family protein, partial [candidate division WOR-3 bacterium]
LLTFLLSIATSDTLYFSLDDAIDYALENNPEIAQLTIDSEKSSAQVGQALSAFYPNISATGYYAYVTDVPVIEFDSVPIPFGTHENYNIQVSLQQVIFSWGKIYNAYKISDMNHEIARLNLLRKRQEIRYSTTNSFYGLLVLEELVKLSEESLAQLKRHEEAVESRYKAGLVSQFDLLRARVQVANLKPKVIGGQNGLNLAREAFKMLLGMPIEHDFEISGELQMIEEDFDLEQLTATALEQRAELTNVKKLESIAKLTKAIARRANLPSIVAGATYERRKPFSFTGDEWGSNITLNIGFQFPLFSGFNNFYQYREASLLLKEAQLAYDNLEKAIILEVKAAYLSLLAAKEALVTAQENVGQAEKAFEIMDTRYKNGLATNLEFMDAQLAFMQAKTNYLSALKNYNTSMAEIYKSIGKEE